MTEEKNINNPYLDIVDAAVLGKGSDAQSTITDILNTKIKDEVDNYSKEYANTMFNGEKDIEEDEVEPETEEPETEENDEKLETESDKD